MTIRRSWWIFRKKSCFYYSILFQNGVVKRFDGLAKLMADRKRKLADSLLVQQLYNDINTEDNWIKEKEAMITGRASCIESVRAMIRTTQSIMQAMHEHEGHVVALIDRGRKLAASMTAHLAELSAQVKQRSDQLAENWTAMKEKAFQRKQSNQLVLLFLFNIKDWKFDFILFINYFKRKKNFFFFQQVIPLG